MGVVRVADYLKAKKPERYEEIKEAIQTTPPDEQPEKKVIPAKSKKTKKVDDGE